MLLPLHLTPASFDHVPTECTASPEWVMACLHHHAMTRHLLIRAYLEGQVTVLEGQVPTRHDRDWAGQVARQALQGATLDNRLLVLDDENGPPQPDFRTWSHPLRAVA